MGMYRTATRFTGRAGVVANGWEKRARGGGTCRSGWAARLPWGEVAHPACKWSELSVDTP